MTRDEFLSLLEWMTPRWTEIAAWSPPEVSAFYEDLAGYRYSDVYDAVGRLWRQGRERAPRASTVLALLYEFDRRPESPALPRPGETGPTVSLGDFLAAAGYGDVAGLISAIKKEVADGDDTSL